MRVSEEGARVDKDKIEEDEIQHLAKNSGT